MRLFLLEDEAPALERLRALLAEAAPAATICGTADSNRAATAWLAQHPAPDLILADIQLSDGLSLELFTRQPPPCPIVFTTAHDDYLLDAFATSGIAYLLKPVKRDDLAGALKKHHELGRHYTAATLTTLAARLGGQASPPPGSRRRLLAQKGLSFQPIAVEDVAYFFSEHKLTFLVTRRAERFVVDQSLAQLESDLPPSEFFRLNRTLLAHVAAIRRFHSLGKGRLAVALDPAPADEVQIPQERAAAFRAWITGPR